MSRFMLCAPRVCAAAAALFALVSSATAQGPGAGAPPQMNPQEMNARMEKAKQAFYKDLGLNPTQITKVEALQKKYMGMAQTRIGALRKKYGEKPTPAQQQEAMKEMQSFIVKTKAESDKELKTILTPAQFQKLQQKNQARRPGGPG